MDGTAATPTPDPDTAREQRLTDPPTSPPVLPPTWPSGQGSGISGPPSLAAPSPTPPGSPPSDGSTQKSAKRSSSEERTSKRAWIALAAFGLLVAVIGTYFVVDHFVASTGKDSSASDALPPLPTDERTGWIPSATYKIPGEIPPGLYRVARGYIRFEDGNDIAVATESTFEGTTLVLIKQNARPGTIEIEGGAWPLKENGPVDPTRFEDGMYLVGFDIQPGTYRVTPVKNRGNIAGAGTVDELGNPTKAEYLDSTDATASAEGITFVIEPGDFAFYFSGHLERVD